MHTHRARLPAEGGPEAGRGTTRAPHLLCTAYDARLQAKQLPKNTILRVANASVWFVCVCACVRACNRDVTHQQQPSLCFREGTKVKRARWGVRWHGGNRKWHEWDKRTDIKGGKGRGEAVKTPAGDKSEIFMK